MARTVDTSSTFEQWRQNYNNLVSDVGDPVALTTGDKSSVVAGINYLMDQYFFFQDFDFDGSDGATSNTVFSGTDNNGNTLQYASQKVLVFKNGLLLRNGTDYTAVDGSNITLASSANNADVIRISSYTGSYTTTPAGAESLFHWQTAGANIFNRNTGGIVFNAGTSVANAVTAPTVANSIQFEGPIYAKEDVYINAQKDLRFRDADSSHYVAIQAPATVSANVTLTLPADDGTSGQFLETNGSGVLTWGTETTYTAGSGLTLSGTAFSVTNEGITNAHILDNTVTADELAVSGDGGNGYALTSDADGTFSWTQFSGSDTTYTTSWVDDSADAILRLTPSTGSADDLTIVAGSGITVTPSGDNLTIAATAGTPTVITIADESSDTTCFPLFVTTATGDQAPKTGSNLAFNSANGTLTATTFAGALTGNVTGNVTGNTSGTSGSTTGNAATATALATGRTIAMSGDIVWNSGSFDGSGNVTAAATIQTDAVDIAMLSASGTASSTTFLRGDNTWVTPTDTDTNTQLSNEQVQDIVGAMFTSNTETRITATYQDGDGTIDLVVDDLDTDTNTWRGVTAGGNTLASNETLAFTAGTNVSITESGGAVTINSTDQYEGTTTASNTQTFTNKTWNGGIIPEAKLQNQSGTNTGDQTTVSGNAGTATALANARTIGGTSFDGTANIAVGLAATATALATARNIGGVSFDGTAAITLPGVNTGGNQNTSGSSATCSGLAGSATALASGRTIGMTGDVAWTSASFDGTGNVTGTSVIQTDAVDIAMLSATGTASNTTFLRGDNTWVTPTDTDTNTTYTAGGGTNSSDTAGIYLSSTTFELGSDYRDKSTLIWGNNTGDYIDYGVTADIMKFFIGTNERMRLTATDTHFDGDVVAFSTTISSDIVLKENINTLKNPLSILDSLRGVSFDWKDKKHGSSVGLIAQDVEKVLPDLVKDHEGLTNHKTLNYNGIIGLLVESIKELKNEVESLKDSKS